MGFIGFGVDTQVWGEQNITLAHQAIFKRALITAQECQDIIHHPPNALLIQLFVALHTSPARRQLH